MRIAVELQRRAALTLVGPDVDSVDGAIVFCLRQMLWIADEHDFR